MSAPTTDMVFTAERVKRIRVGLGETQGQFAERIGVNINIVSRWESGGVRPTRGPILKALLDAEAEAVGA